MLVLLLNNTVLHIFASDWHFRVDQFTLGATLLDSITLAFSSFIFDRVQSKEGSANNKIQPTFPKVLGGIRDHC